MMCFKPISSYLLLCSLSLLLASGTAACQNSGSRLAPLVEQLKSNRQPVRDSAAARIYRLGREGLTKAEAREALEAAAARFPNSGEEWEAPEMVLIDAAGSVQDPGQADIIRNHFARYSKAAKFRALNLLASMERSEATRAYTDLALKHARELPDLPIGTLGEKPRDLRILFPALLKLGDIPEMEYGVFQLLLSFFEKSQFRRGEFDEHAQVLLDAYRRHESVLRPRQQAAGVAWMRETEYLQSRAIAGLLLDLMAHFDSREVRAELHEALSYRDPWLKLFAITSSLRGGTVVPAAHFAEVAAAPETRGWLFRNLSEQNRSDLFPPMYATKQSFAESAMVSWLTYPTELGSVPDSIELMRTISEGDDEYYLFRFNSSDPDWAGEGWMAGVAGPFDRTAPPSPDAGGGTFSAFEPWESKTPEEHLQSLADILDKAYKNNQEMKEALENSRR